MVGTRNKVLEKKNSMSQAGGLNEALFGALEDMPMP